MRKICLIAILVLCSVIARGQLYLKQNEYQQQLNNGLQLFYTHQPNSNKYEVVLAYRFGSLVEDSLTDGLAYVCHTAFINGLQQQIKKVDGSIKIDGRFGFEMSTYRFSVPKAKFSAALDAIAQHYQNLPDSAAIHNAILQNAALLAVAQNTLMYPAEQALLKQHWGPRAPAMSIYGNQPVPDSTTIKLVRHLYNTGYCLEKGMMVFTGAEGFKDVWRISQDKLGYINICKDLRNNTLVNLFPQPKYSVQLVYKVGSATPTRYQKLYHAPYLAYDVNSVLAALVLKTILAQPAPLGSMYDSLGIAQLKLAFDPMRQTGGLTWHLFPKQDSIHTAYANLDTLMQLLADSAIIPTQQIEAAKTKLLQQFETMRKDPAQNAYLIGQYWAQNILPWLMDYPTLIKGIDHSHINKLIKSYVLGKNYTVLLLLNDSDSLVYDYQKFSSTYTHVENITLNFQKNTANFLSPADDSTLNTLKQTLLINQSLIISINAQAHKSELLKVKDDSLTKALCSYPEFYVYPKNLLHKETYRLDIYRAAKVVERLLQVGVDPKQLKGTGQLIKGEDNGTYKATVTGAY